MRGKLTEKHIRVAWRILCRAHDLFEQQDGKLNPHQLGRVREVWEELAQWVVKFEDGPAVLYQTEARKQQLRDLEGMASNLIFMVEHNKRIKFVTAREALNYRADLH